MYTAVIPAKAGTHYSGARAVEAWAPAYEAVRKSRIAWIGIVRPSRRPRSLSSGRAQPGPVCGLLRTS